MSVGSTTLMTNGQEDISNGGIPPICTCGVFPTGKIGVAIGFWEPVRQIDVTKTSWCFTSLGGLDLSAGIPTPTPTASKRGTNGKRTATFYQAHWYTNPILFALKVLLETSCLETGALDLTYISELDPMWNDDELTMILSPDVFLFANPIAQAACAADCVAATTGFPISSMQWCAGCQGSMYPVNGNVGTHIGGVQASSLILQRYTMKLHRQLMTMSGHGSAGLCNNYPAPILDKTSYKYSMTYPTPQGKGITGKCCQPLGRSTQLWESAKEYPINGEDFAYMLYRKRNCCQRVLGLMK